MEDGKSKRNQCLRFGYLLSHWAVFLEEEYMLPLVIV